MAKYTKLALSIEEQISLLKNRNLAFGNLDYASNFLAYSNYYRLSGYYAPFVDRNRGDWFLSGASFEHIADLYHFDRKLRLCVWEGISAVEISFRSQMGYILSIGYGPFALLDSQIFTEGYDVEFNSRIVAEIKRSKETFVKHFEKNYEEYLNLPVWALTEILSFGVFSALPR